MGANELYNQVSLLRFQVSMLSLAAAIDLPAPIGSKMDSTTALVEAERLKHWVEHKT